MSLTLVLNKDISINLKMVHCKFVIIYERANEYIVYYIFMMDSATAVWD